MHPVRDFKANFSQPFKTESATDTVVLDGASDVSLHDTDNSARNLCFVWDDGRKAFFNYAYLVTVNLTVQDDLNVLLLSFGSYTVIVKGYSLEPLFDLLMDHFPKIIKAVNPRYVAPRDSESSVVIEIVVTSE